MVKASNEPDVEVYRLWDWSGLIGLCAGVVAAGAWFVTDNGHQRAPVQAPGQYQSVDTPDVIWWLPYIFGATFGLAGLAVQSLLERANTLVTPRVRDGLLIAGCTAGGAGAAGAVWLIPQQLVFQDTAGHGTTLSRGVVFVALPVLGLLVGTALAARRHRTASTTSLTKTPSLAH
ncbi:hypothetical protein C7458_10511 [Williamsia muralis]|nr:hypothetical protein C7458_10511 [Williamsia marianensis]